MAEAPERLLFGHVFKYLHTVTEQAPNVARATDVGRCTVFRFAGLLVGMVAADGPVAPECLAACRTVDPTLPTVVYALPGTLPKAAQMEAMGFLPPSLTPVMRAEVAELPAQEAPPSGLTIAEVADDVAYAHLLAVQRETLGETYTLRAQLKRMLDAWLPGTVRHLLGQMGPNRTGVAAATLTLEGSDVTLWGIGTLPAYRGRGIGWAMTLASCRLGKTVGASRALLYATPDGYPVYQRLGFREDGGLMAVEAPPQSRSGSSP